MGMGEPLHNYDAVMTALEIITDRARAQYRPRAGSRSAPSAWCRASCGWRRKQRPYNLAVSLHGATEEERAALVPASRRWPLAELIAACRTYGATTGAAHLLRVDADRRDERLARASRGGSRRCSPGIDAPRESDPAQSHGRLRRHRDRRTAAAADFSACCESAGIPCTVRQRRGIDVAAGCGQLRAEKQSR